MKAGRAVRATTRARRPKRSTRGGSKELLERAAAPVRGCSGSARWRRRPDARPERREPRRHENLVGGLRGRARRAGRAPSRHRRARRRPDQGLRPGRRSRRQFPDRFVECGIAEQDMVSMAGGMARRGALPSCTRSPASWRRGRTSRSTTSAARRSKVIYVGSLAGLLPGGPGHSHQSVRDISRARARCRTCVLAEPCGEAEVHALFDYLVGTRDRERLPAARVGEVADAVRVSRRPARRRRARAGSSARDATRVVFGYGPWLLANAWHAAEELEQTHRRHDARLVNLPWLNRVDAGWLRDAIGERRAVVHARQPLRARRPGRDGGGGDRRARRSSRPSRVTRVGVTELPECGTNDEVLAYHGLDVAGAGRGVPRGGREPAPGAVSPA